MPTGIEAQTEQCLENIKAILEASESSIENVAKCCYLQSIFRKNYPARSCVEVANLPKSALIEIEAIEIVK